MLKYKKRKSTGYRDLYKVARRTIKPELSWDWFRLTRQLNRRGHMKIKAARWRIRHDCYECQQEHLEAGLVEHVEKKLGIHLEAQQGYHPIDEIIPKECEKCRFVMRGGKH